MRHEEIIFAGFGGQGVLFSGQLLTYAGMAENLYVTWIPSYGPEMRGGTANCTVILSEEEIGAPIVRHPSVAVVFNAPSMRKYEPSLKPGGLAAGQRLAGDGPASARTTSASSPSPPATSPPNWAIRASPTW